MPNHDSRLCAQLGHFIGSLAVIYCPHHQGWTAIVAAGDDQDDMCIRHARLDFGPFDTHEDALAEVASHLAQLMRVDVRTWVSLRDAAGGAV